MHGFGIYSWKDGSSYQGEWESGAMHGCGTYTPKADKQNQAQAQEGQFLSNEFVGLGLACPVDTARFAAKEAKHFAERAQSFELKSQWRHPIDLHLLDPYCEYDTFDLIKDNACNVCV